MLLDKYLPRIDFDSYEDFKANYRVNVPADFNFGFDIVDEWAKQEPEKKALVWCDDEGGDRTFTFTDISRLSNQAANYFTSLGIRKGTVVMLILRRRWEYWVCAVALHKIGAILIPGSLQLAKKDLIYRGNSAKIHTMICVDDSYVIEQVDHAQPSVPSIQHKIIVGKSREGWRNFHEEVAAFPETFARPTGDAATKVSDTMIVYFTSGTTGDPKMVQHDFSHPLGHIVTAKYWQQVQENKLHMSVSDSGWAKFGWGKIYGQWICGAVIFAYDMAKFVPTHLLQKMQDYKLTTFCAPPTMYRFMLQEDVAAEPRGILPVAEADRQGDSGGLRSDRGHRSAGKLPVDHTQARLYRQALSAVQHYPVAGRRHTGSGRRARCAGNAEPEKSMAHRSVCGILPEPRNDTGDSGQRQLLPPRCVRT